jgi:hypothetical protein
MCLCRCVRYTSTLMPHPYSLHRQSVGILLTFGGIVLGHTHGGREFPPSAHEKLGSIIVIPLLIQLVLGIYLKLHIHERSIRPYAVVLHGIVGKSYPIWGWVQMLFGGFLLVGDYCRGGRLGQCLAHYIMVRRGHEGELCRVCSLTRTGGWLHRIWHHHGNHVCRRRRMGAETWSCAGVV